MTPLLPNHNRCIQLLLSEASNTAGTSSIYAGVSNGGLLFYRGSLYGTVNVTFFKSSVVLQIVPRSVRQWPPEDENTPPRFKALRRALGAKEIEFDNILKLLKQ